MVSGGLNLVEGAEWGAGVGGLAGAVATNSIRGFATGGLWGGAIGATYGTAYGVGTWVNDNVINPWLWGE
jgi:hypothetical protein